MIRDLSRRDLLKGSATLLGVTASAAGLLRAKGHVSKSRVSAITDEIAPTQGEAITFAKQYGLQWVDLRYVPKSKDTFASLPAAELKQYAAQLAENKLRVALLRTNVLKSDAAPANDELAQAIKAAQILGTDRIVIFSGARTGDPASSVQKLAKALGELLPLAESAKVRLLIENDASQIVGTSAELKSILDFVPSKSLGFNWNPQSSIALHEMPFPEGYAGLPKNRLWNVQIDIASLDGPNQINWRRVLDTMQRDGFQGGISVETGPFDNSFDKPGDVVREAMHIVGEVE